MNSQEEQPTAAKRYRLTVAYDGTNYAGWQVQPNGTAVQAVIEATLAGLCGHACKVHGSGRTDQGVHARGQVAHTDLVTRIPPAALQRALNAKLPADIRIVNLRRAAADFHARKQVRRKEYRYFIWNGEVVPPFVARYRARVVPPLDVARMRAAAALLVGRHDFASFTANPNRVVESTVRTVTRLDVRRRGPEIVICAEGEGFLFRMVRSIAGHLIRVGEGAVPPETTAAVLAARTRTAHVPTAPAQGLFLWRVTY